MDLNRMQEMNADGNIDGLLQEQNSELFGMAGNPSLNAFGDELEADGDSDEEIDGTPDYEYFVEDYVDASGVSKRKIKRVEKKYKKVLKKQAKAKPGSKKAERLTRKVKMQTGKLGAVKTAGSKAEARAKIAQVRAQHGSKIGKGVQKVGKVVKAGGLAPQRGAALGIIAINGFGIASKLKKLKDADKKKYDEVRFKWLNWGGNRTKFDQNVEKGSKKKPLAINWKKKKGADGCDEDILTFNPAYMSANGANEYMSATGVELMVVAAPLIIGLLEAVGGKKEDGNLDAETIASMESETAQQTPELKAAMAEQKEINDLVPESERDITGMPPTKWMLIGIGGLALIGAIWYFTRKKK